MKRIAPALLAVLLCTSACEIMPRNTIRDCRLQCEDSKNPKACYEFCDCIHKNCQSLDSCLVVYEKGKKELAKEP